MKKFVVTVEKTILGSMVVEADDYDEAFAIAEDAGEDGFEFDEDCASIDWNMMNAREV